MFNLVKLVGSNIKEIRKTKKMTQEELAEKCSLQSSYLAGVERGERNITLQTLEKIIIGLEEVPASIFNFEGLDINQDYFDKKELITLLLNIVENKSDAEIRLIMNIASEIFSTYSVK